MTQHILQQDSDADTRIMRRLGLVIAGFMAATIVMATVIGVILG